MCCLTSVQLRDEASIRSAERVRVVPTLRGEDQPDHRQRRDVRAEPGRGSVARRHVPADQQADGDDHLADVVDRAFSVVADPNFPACLNAAFTGLLNVLGATGHTPLFMLFSGGLMLGAVYMATDMVTSPVTRGGAWIFGAGIGLLVVLIRVWGGLPEGVMYAILLMNAVVPVINRATRPRVFGTPPRAPRIRRRREVAA